QSQVQRPIRGCDGICADANSVTYGPGWGLASTQIPARPRIGRWTWHCTAPERARILPQSFRPLGSVRVIRPAQAPRRGLAAGLTMALYAITHPWHHRYRVALMD